MAGRLLAAARLTTLRFTVFAFDRFVGAGRLATARFATFAFDRFAAAGRREAPARLALAGRFAAARFTARFAAARFVFAASARLEAADALDAFDVFDLFDAFDTLDVTARLLVAAFFAAFALDLAFTAEARFGAVARVFAAFFGGFALRVLPFPRALLLRTAAFGLPERDALAWLAVRRSGFARLLDVAFFRGFLVFFRVFFAAMGVVPPIAQPLPSTGRHCTPE